MDPDQLSSLKKVVVGALEKNGVLERLKAELRACVFSIIDEQDDQGGLATRSTNPRLLALQKTSQGAFLLSAVREFLTYCGLEFTLKVYEPEVGYTAEGPADFSSPLPAHMSAADALPLAFPSALDAMMLSGADPRSEGAPREPLLLAMLRAFETSAAANPMGAPPAPAPAPAPASLTPNPATTTYASYPPAAAAAMIADKDDEEKEGDVRQSIDLASISALIGGKGPSPPPGGRGKPALGALSVDIPTQLPTLRAAPRPQPTVHDFEDPDFEDPPPSNYATRWEDSDSVLRASVDPPNDDHPTPSSAPGVHSTEVPGTQHAAPSTMAAAALAADASSESVAEVAEEDIVVLEEEEEDFDALVRDAGIASSPPPAPAPTNPLDLSLERAGSGEGAAYLLSPQSALTSPVRPRVLAPLGSARTSLTVLEPAGGSVSSLGALSPSTSHRASVSEDDLKHELRQLGIIRSPSSADPTDGRRSGGLSDVVDAPVGLAHADMRGSLDGHNVSVEDVEGSLTQYNISVQYEETAGAPGGGGPASQRMVFGEESESEYDVQGEGGSAEVPEYSVEDYEGSLSQANLGMDYEESLRDL